MSFVVYWFFLHYGHMVSIYTLLSIILPIVLIFIAWCVKNGHSAFTHLSAHPFRFVGDTRMAKCIMNVIDKQAFCLIRDYSDGNIRPIGFILCTKPNNPYIAYISRTESDRGPNYHIWIICSDMTIKMLTTQQSSSALSAEDEGANTEEYRTLDIVNFYTVSSWGCYISTAIFYSEYSPIPATQQSKIINDMCQIFQDRRGSKGTIFYVNGPPGTGKTVIGKLLAIKLGAKLCPRFSPTVPGQTLSAIYESANPCKKQPLVIVINEVYELLKSIVDGIEFGKSDVAIIEAANKLGWNNMTDYLEHYMPHTLVLLTSNKSRDEVCSELQDDSLLRDRRVNGVFVLHENPLDEGNKSA